MALAPWEKILPNQAFNANLLDGGRNLEKDVYDTVLRCCGIKAPHADFHLETSNLHTVEEMASSPVTLRFLQWLLRAVGARRVLEIGGFIGLSTMYFARSLPPGGRVVSIEKFEEFANIAKRNFAANHLADKIELIHGDANVVLPTLGAAPFDFVFIDGNKERYAFYLSAAIPIVRPGGIIAVDDVFFHGDALNDHPGTEKGRGVRECLSLAESLSGWDRTLLPISNGLMLLSRPAS